MTKDEFFLHHFFTEEEAQIAGELIYKQLSLPWSYEKKRYEGHNSGKPYWTVVINDRNFGRLIELQQYINSKYSRDDLALFIIDIMLKEIYEHMTQN